MQPAPEEVALPEAEAEAAQCASAPPANLTLADLAALRARGEKIVLIDVREPHEWERKRLACARLLPLASLLTDPDLVDSLDAQATGLVAAARGSITLRPHTFLAWHPSSAWTRRRP